MIFLQIDYRTLVSDKCKLVELLFLIGHASTAIFLYELDRKIQFSIKAETKI